MVYSVFAEKVSGKGARNMEQVKEILKGNAHLDFI